MNSRPLDLMTSAITPDAAAGTIERCRAESMHCAAERDIDARYRSRNFPNAAGRRRYGSITLIAVYRPVRETPSSRTVLAVALFNLQSRQREPTSSGRSRRGGNLSRNLAHSTKSREQAQGTTTLGQHPEGSRKRTSNSARVAGRLSRRPRNMAGRACRTCCRPRSTNMSCRPTSRSRCSRG